MRKSLLSEEARLRAVERYAVLDTPREPDFDRLVRIAAGALRAPAAALGIVDRNRQFLKAAIGIRRHETPREGSFAAWAMARRRVSSMTVPSGLALARIGNRRARFVAGAPLIAPGGAVIGALGVFDVRRRSLARGEGEVLEELGRRAMCLLEERRLRLVRGFILSALEGEISDSVDSLRSAAAAELRTRESRGAVRILAGVERLDGQLDALRELAELTLGAETAPRREKLDLRALCEGILAELAAGVGVRFEFAVEGECTGFWERDRLFRAAALIFEEARDRAETSRDARVRVHVTCAADDFVKLTITLTAGLEEPVAVRIHLARELMLRQGGTIEYQRVGGDSVFTIRLPRARS
jgi:signal transduction histidine kinase